MSEQRVRGATDVAALLRTIADGVDARRISVGDRIVPCQDDLIAVLQVPSEADGRALIINVRLTAESKTLPVIALEEELAHPGG